MLSYDTDGHMNTSLYDKRDDFNFSITNFPFLSSNIPSSPAYGVFISQLIRYARASTKYTDFVLRARRLSDKLLSQGYVCDRLTSSLRKFYGRYGELVIHYDVPLSRMTYLQTLVSGYNKLSDGFWTDMTTLRFDGTKSSSGRWMWGQYIPVDNSTIQWEMNPTCSPVETCGALNIQAAMTNWECSKKMGFICEMDNTAYSGCPFGWMPTDTTCYYFSDLTDPTQKLTWMQAKAYCANMQLPPNVTTPAHLLTMDNNYDYNYILSEMPEVAQTTVMFWTGLTRTGTQWRWFNNDNYNPSFIQWAKEPDNINNNENCAIIKTDGHFSDQDCSQNFNYICRATQSTDDTDYYMGCKGWSRAGHKCFKFFDNPKSTWASARQHCQVAGGDLLRVDSVDEKRWMEWQMSTNDHASYYWTGLNDQAVEGNFRWTDGSPVKLSNIRWNSEPNNWFGNEDCAVILNDAVWSDGECSLPTNYICEYINPSGGNCPSSPGWISNTNSGECYYFSPSNITLSWFEANAACRDFAFSKNTPTSLLAINSKEELNIITKVLANPSKVVLKGYWTDLNDRNHEGTWSYTDGFNNPPNMNLVLWNAEPKDVNGTKDCGLLGFGARYFEKECSGKAGFICFKYPTACDAAQDNLGCSPGWVAWQGNCYFVQTKKLVTRKNANIDCANLYGTLLRSTSSDEMTYLQTLVSGYNKLSDGFWTDMTTLRFDGTKSSSGRWMWGQYIPVDNSTIQWEMYPTSSPVETCGALNIQAAMTNWECSKKMGFICEMDNTAYSGCPFGWMPTDTTCYYFSDLTDPTQKLTWMQAKAYCANMQLPPNVTTPAHLLTMDNNYDYNYILSEMPEVAQTTVMFWTGLTRTGTQWGWFNGDNYNPTFIQWAKEPDNINNNENCAIIKTDGHFSDQDCSQNYNYICRASQSTDDTDYYMGCQGWSRAGHKCFNFFDQPKSTWATARQNCQAAGGDLLRIDSVDEKRWMEWQMSTTDHASMYWTGLNDQAVEGNFRWTDGSPVNQANIRWNSEPNEWFGNEDCAVIFNDAVWNDRDCSLPTNYICEYINPSGGNCPSSPGWVSNTNSGECYFFSPSNATLSWFEANTACRNYAFSKSTPTSLLAVNSQEELDYIASVLAIPTNFALKGYWTDLNDRNHEGTWSYTDGFNNPPNMNLVQWNAEPKDVNGTEDCGLLGFGARYFESKCGTKAGFICYKYPIDGLYGADRKTCAECVMN
ncbi:hypothetical protein FSP39_017933 [Pinctada imbricata]|uniref:C-type lectin domain-containing protein n=1 Tax=Pinctada imbricata TaxID=66713 RepID=A0AA88Y5D0_PINIB|nr:hypothetical protein FSP39_017933 [Pinctada imbricata]